MKAMIEWVPGGVPPKWEHYLVTTENDADARSVMEAWWNAGKNQWESDEFALWELGLTVVAYAELPEPWGGEAE